MNTLINPIFIFGSYRSGTTMLASHLAANNKAIALPEMPFIQMLITSQAFDEVGVTKLYQQMTKTFHYRATGISIDFETFAQPFYNKEPPEERVYNLLRYHFKLPQNTSITWIEHTPHNRERVRLYQSIFPKAKFIHIMRDPRAVYSSMHKLARWNSNDPLAFANKWNDSMTYSFLAKSQLKQSCFELCYEDYLLNQDEKLSELCHFIGLKYEEKMKSSGGISLPEYTLKQHSLVGKDVNTARIDAWKNSITTREAELITWRCLPWLLHYDYCSSNETVKPAKKFESFKFKVKQKLFSPFAKLKRLKDSLIT